MKMSSIEHGVIGAITILVILAAWWWVKRDAMKFRKLIAITAAATFVLIVLGAFVRLSDAGLGCPDWPGCYGNLTPHFSAEQIQAAEAVQPGGPVSMAKAWKEMVHRYLAMFVGALIASIMFAAWRNRREWQQSPWLPTLLVVAVMFQAALGAWTVTLLLKPAIVTAHLLGGIGILSLLSWLLSKQPGNGKWADGIMAPDGLRVLGFVALVVLFAQIMLGGWVSTNYAALACIDLPTCHGAWAPKMDFKHGFQLLRELGHTAAGDKLSYDALTAIHWTHRVGALVVASYLLLLAWLTARAGLRLYAILLVGLVAAQFTLGVANILTGLKLAVAVAHNAGAALLLVALVVLNSALSED